MKYTARIEYVDNYDDVYIPDGSIAINFTSVDKGGITVNRVTWLEPEC